MSCPTLWAMYVSVDSSSLILFLLLFPAGPWTTTTSAPSPSPASTICPNCVLCEHMRLQPGWGGVENQTGYFIEQSGYGAIRLYKGFWWRFQWYFQILLPDMMFSQWKIFSIVPGTYIFGINGDRGASFQRLTKPLVLWMGKKMGYLMDRNQGDSHSVHGSTEA